MQLQNHSFNIFREERTHEDTKVPRTHKRQNVLRTLAMKHINSDIFVLSFYLYKAAPAAFVSFGLGSNPSCSRQPMP